MPWPQARCCDGILLLCYMKQKQALLHRQACHKASCQSSHRDMTTGKLSASSCGMVRGSPTSGSPKSVQDPHLNSQLVQQVGRHIRGKGPPKDSCSQQRPLPGDGQLQPWVVRSRPSSSSTRQQCRVLALAAIKPRLPVVMTSREHSWCRQQCQDTCPVTLHTREGEQTHPIDKCGSLFTHYCSTGAALVVLSPAAAAQASTAAPSCPLICRSSLSDLALPASNRSAALSSWAAGEVDPGLYTWASGSSSSSSSSTGRK